MQKTVYEMRIGVWSSDVCSSDLGRMPSQLTPQVTVVYWRDIPAQVIAKAGRKTAKVQLTERFEKAIDRAAMRAKLTGTDAYLEHWRRGAPAPAARISMPKPPPRRAGWKATTTTPGRSEEHTSELQSLMRLSYAVFCLKKTKQTH